MSRMSEHMDAYYLRRILRRMTDKEMECALNETSSSGMEKMKRYTPELPSNLKADHVANELDEACKKTGLKGKEMKDWNLLHELKPVALQVLHELVSLVHDHVKVSDNSQPVQSTPIKDSAGRVKGEDNKIVTATLFRLEDDPVAKILWALEPSTLQHVFLAMAYNFPRTLEALILHLLSPVGAEVLTRKFDEMDQRIPEEDRNKFYQVFYGAFDVQFNAIDAILNGKESFALKAFKNILDKYVGVNFDGPNPGVK